METINWQDFEEKGNWSRPNLVAWALIEAMAKKWVIGFTCCCRQNAVLKHAGVSFGFTCCYNEGSPIAGEQSWSQ